MTSRSCRCISGPGSASAICRRKPRSSAASLSKTISARCSKSWSPTRKSGRAISTRCLKSSTSRGCAKRSVHRSFRRRAAALRNCTRAGDAAELGMLLDEPFRRHRSDRRRRYSIAGAAIYTNRGIGVLITDHNVRETLGLTDRAYIIYSGEVLMEGRADDIVNNPDVRRLYLGEEFRL